MSEFPDIWIFDANRRVYRKDANGRSIGGPVWYEHWRKDKIEGETSRSWILVGGQKIPKKNPPKEFVAFSEEEIRDRAWVEANLHKIVRHMSYGEKPGYDALKQIAELIGYKEDER